MGTRSSKKPAITLIFSDTGGGHRAAAEAIIEAIHSEYGDRFVTRMVDFLKEYAPWPLNYLPELYPPMVKSPGMWGKLFDLSNGRPQARLITSAFWPYVRRASIRFANEHRREVLVSVHPLANYFALRALGKSRLPYFTVVTDLVTAHAIWFDRRSDLIFVPTQMARQRALDYGMPSEKVRLVGQPVSIRYSLPAGDRRLLRTRLGWPLDKPVALLVGGGEGLGPLASFARTIDASGLDLSLAVVTGRNAALAAELKALFWEKPTFIYGFVAAMPELMRAADILVTKAGPGTIAEALSVGLPMLLYAKLNGQENGNVDFVVQEKVGLWTPDPASLVSTLRRWIEQPGERQAVAGNCRRAALPYASRTIARIIGERAASIDLPAEVPGARPFLHTRHVFPRLRPAPKKA
jgi:1,2-diacylglycerol 3-beta-galactosyltransferase